MKLHRQVHIFVQKYDVYILTCNDRSGERRRGTKIISELPKIGLTLSR